jgi:hypothetical protein
MVKLKGGGEGIKFSIEKDKQYILTKQIDRTTTISTSSSIPIYPDEWVNGMEFSSSSSLGPGF